MRKASDVVGRARGRAISRRRSEDDGKRREASSRPFFFGGRCDGASATATTRSIALDPAEETTRRGRQRRRRARRRVEGSASAMETTRTTRARARHRERDDGREPPPSVRGARSIDRDLSPRAEPSGESARRDAPRASPGRAANDAHPYVVNGEGTAIDDAASSLSRGRAARCVGGPRRAIGPSE